MCLLSFSVSLNDFMFLVTPLALPVLNLLVKIPIVCLMLELYFMMHTLFTKRIFYMSYESTQFTKYSLVFYFKDATKSDFFCFCIS